VQSRLGKIKREFTRLIDAVNEKEHAKKYHALLDRIIQAVIYRNKWYRNFAKSIIGDLINNKKQNGGGGNSTNSNVMSMSHMASFETPQKEPENLLDAPMAFVATPAEFKRILLRHQTCMKSVHA
jgi:hypothetical protein